MDNAGHSGRDSSAGAGAGVQGAKTVPTAVAAAAVWPGARRMVLKIKGARLYSKQYSK